MEQLVYLKEFLASERAEGKAQATLRNHYKSLKQLETWLAENGNKAPQNVTVHDLVDYVNFLRERHVPEAVNIYISATRRYFHWLAEMDLLEGKKNPAEKMRFLSAQPKPVEAISPVDAKKLIRWLQQARKERFGTHRTALVAVFMLDCGCRIGEVLRLKTEDLDLINGQALVKAAKTHSIRVIPLSAPLQGQLRAFIARRSSYLAKRNLPDKSWLFPGEHGEEWTVGSAERGIRYIAQRVGIKGLRPHVLRHSFARLSVMNGMNLPALMRIGGWKKLSIVQRYASLTDEQCAEVHAVTSPLVNLR
jgi:integrase/recombinase XerD